MTNLSGLKLNAEKTEIIQNRGPQYYNIIYNSSNHTIPTSNMIKVNGLFLSFDSMLSRETNISKIQNSLLSQLKAWSHQHLTLLGKIQIFKTYGLSQILFISATIKFSRPEEKKMEHLIYKFLWSKNLDGNKAPDRIKRSILNTPINYLGFGMIDFKDVVRSTRIKTVLRLLNYPNRPLHEIIKSKTNNSIFLHQQSSIRPSIDEAIKDIRSSWQKLIKDCPEPQTISLLNIIRNEYVGNILQNKFKNKRLGLLHRHDKIDEIINTNRLHPIIAKLDKPIQKFISNLDINLKLDPIYDNDIPYSTYFPTTSKIKLSSMVTSKEIRDFLKIRLNLNPKMLSQATVTNLKSLGYKINKLTNVKLKTILLRSIHGDIYSGTRLKKFGMAEDDKCPRCNLPETIEHQLLECDYCKRLWSVVSIITSIPITNLNTVLGLHDLHDKTTLTINAEVIRRLLSIERINSDITAVVKSVINNLTTLENVVTKHQLIEMQKVLHTHLNLH